MEYNSFRRKSRLTAIGKTAIGLDRPIAIQSMTNTDPHDVTATLTQIGQLQAAGCRIVRMAYPDHACAKTVEAVKNAYPDLPLVADIHFDYRLAIEAVDAGADKIRINPGNIGDSGRIKAVVNACKVKNIPIRVGVNSGSLQKEVLARYDRVCAEALAESALLNVREVEKNDYDNIVVAVKSSDVRTMIRATRMVAEQTEYPIHIGVTESGTVSKGSIKSFVGIGSLLCDGIGDTLRISLTDHPVREVEEAKKLLASLSLSEEKQFNLISCPTCGRTCIDLIDLANRVEKALESITPKRHLDIALMGCAVNGPGEAAGADIGIAGGKGEALLFKKGKKVRMIPEETLIEELLEEIERLNAGE
ncbi:MAG: flavodoxin-dependent (E)-4-hydroxy-3-methylbut-2-enyl-diphosphate synthase [Ruminococcaceae bacterium]|nr:flavodoxin-dependent (E)-4-hydroxy-3-methylbut-2-enyl-diphosphate synthase [Oscillospiraceae bacterium]